MCADKPDLICANLIKVYASQVFDLSTPGDVNRFSLSESISQMDPYVENPIMGEISNDAKKTDDKVVQLSKLCFMVGHVAVKEIVHLEAIESEWKRRKYLGIFIYLIIRQIPN